MPPRTVEHPCKDCGAPSCFVTAHASLPAGLALLCPTCLLVRAAAVQAQRTAKQARRKPTDKAR
jgi:hypothetical protein